MIYHVNTHALLVTDWIRADYFGINSSTVTVSSSEIDVATITIPSVLVNDRLYIQVMMSGTKGATSGLTAGFVRKKSGTADLILTNNSDSRHMINGVLTNMAFNTGALITVAGDLTLALRAQSSGSSWPVLSGKGMFWVTVERGS